MSIEERIMIIIDDKSESSSKEIIWADSSWKEIIEKLVSSEAVRKECVKSIAQFKSDIELDIEYSTDLVDRLKKNYEKQREELKAFYAAEHELSYSLWEELDTQRGQMHAKIKEIKEELNNGLRQELTKLQNEIHTLNLYGFDKLLEAIEHFNRMDDKDKELLAIAFSGYKRNG